MKDNSNKDYIKKKVSIFDMERPKFPKRAVVTGGMPYGNKKLHFGHVGGMFVHADAAERTGRRRQDSCATESEKKM